ncbi:MAG: acyltransferase [Methylobacillus sp.]|jgi:predicted LPLAT superfamily acyltransferase|nr:acyltransferase [Methylobacillus sp.]
MMSARHTSKPKHWAQIREVTSVLGIRFLFQVNYFFGKLPFRIVMYPILIWHLLRKSEARLASKNYLRRVKNMQHPALPDPGMTAVFRHFVAFSENLLDTLRVWNGLIRTEDVMFFGEKPLVELIDKGTGCLLICAHFGNLELCKLLSGKRPGLKITMLVHTRHAEKFNALLKEVNVQSSLNLMQVTEITPATAILLAEKVRQGEFVVIAGDRIPVSDHPRVTTVPFLGENAPFPVGPWILANLLQCPVYLIFSIPAEKGYEIHFEFFHGVIRMSRRERNAICAELAAAYARRLEHYCLKTPLQWFNFYDFWHLPARNTDDAH